ncbi:semaphorin-4D isoform 2-T8 [Clarias gariepinus]|uniref:semaphorin-4D n=1 Tax=Clarias gariepinus TaxID=13013 RepID=UPI00234D45E3|nr:semaphorin-4D [Clarias gariepinus]XP_053334522.1 semaphorin-4D [Clarias gariepinus]XP_053334523.1 semaphorin-4D [Clarias gariepinus]XP_053334524.1 semaphorin-4D [Clarias gariepinus]XP_053334525.1 semaphorin-4D [Clarias gariepinus]XP_053334526.1 semaphorin-4D [Clarias gariepinus]
MALSVLGVFLGLLLEVSTHGPSSVPRTLWRHEEISLAEFSEPGVCNYSTLLLSEERGALYVGAREAVFQLDLSDVSIKKNQVLWKVPEGDMRLCTLKGKSAETDCQNYIRVLQILDEERLYVCGTHAFQPLCDYLSLKNFTLMGKQDDGRGKCSFDPTHSFTSVMVDGELYSGTAYNFLGSEPIISRFSWPQRLLRTEYSTSWLNEPSFVFADVIREGSNSPDGDDDKIYYFFTEVSVEYDFFGKLLIPRIARVCKGDLGGQRTLQKKWTSFLKAKLVCSMPELNFVFNVIHDVFIVKTSDWRETVIYGVFTSQWGNMGLSAVCAYNMTSVDEVFSKGKYMQKATVEQSHTKWVQYNGITPSPRPGACINNQNRMQNITNSLLLPDKTLQFVKDHPLMADAVLPIGHGPRLIAKNVNYTQIVVERVTALDNNVYDVLFASTDKGFLHKSVVYEGGPHIIEEIQLLKSAQPIKTLLLSTQEGSFLYAGSDSGVVQSPTAFCDKYVTCEDCILARDPYCAWDTHAVSCINVFQKKDNRHHRRFIQNLRGDAEECPSARPRSIDRPDQMVVKPGSSAELSCDVRSQLAQVFWKVNGNVLTESPHVLLMADQGLLVYSVSPQDQGHYECWTVESAAGKNFTRLVASYDLRLELPEISLASDILNGDPPTSRTAAATTTAPPRGNNGNNNAAGASPLTPSALSSVPPPPLTRPATTANVYAAKPDTKHYVPPHDSDPREQGPEIKDPHATYLQYDNSKALLFLFLLFFLLFLFGLGYNCYMQYLPGPCLRLRAALLGSQKKPQREYAACEAGLMDKPDQAEPQRQNGAIRDTGYETEPECGNGKVTSNSYEQDSESASKQGPFDVNCESQPIEYADADAS